MKTNCARKNKKLIFFLFLLNTLWFSCSFTKTIPFYLITDDEPKQKIPISCKETVTTTAKKERGKDVASFEIVFMLESAEDGDEEELEEEQIAEAPAETTEEE